MAKSAIVATGRDGGRPPARLSRGQAAHLADNALSRSAGFAAQRNGIVGNDARVRAEALFAAPRPLPQERRETNEAPAKARKAERGPIFVNGERLGRLALWT